MPREWEEHWPISDGDGRAVEKDETDPEWLTLSDERRRAIDRIGNLTLVTSNFNGSVSNHGWCLKRPEFEKQKSLVINYGVAQADSWNEAAIAERARDLAAATARLWPAPETLLSPERDA